MIAYDGDIEDAKRAVAERLRSAQFLDLLAAIDARKGGATTPPPVSIFEGEKAVAVDEGYPVGAVVGARTAYSTDANVEKDAAHEIQVVWTDTGDDELVMTRNLERLVRATRDLFWPAGTSGLVLQEIRSAPVIVRGDEYSALMPTDEHGPFIKAASTQLLITTYAL